jgi:hypothetical protein
MALMLIINFIDSELKRLSKKIDDIEKKIETKSKNYDDART